MGTRSRSARLVVAIAVALIAVVPTISATAGAAEPVHFQPTPLASWRTNGIGYTSLVVGNIAYVGGTFSTVRNPSGSTTVTRQNLAAFDVTTGALITSFTANTNGIVRALASDGSRLYVGGLFTTVNGTTRRRVAAVNLLTGAVDTSWSADASSNVYALAVGGGRLFVGGSFSTLKGQSRPRLGAVRLSDGAIESFAPNPDGTVLALATDGSNVYAGGSFTHINGTSRPYVAGLNSSGALRPIAWTNVNDSAFSMSISADGTRLAVGYSGLSNQGAVYNTSTGKRLWNQRCGGDAQAVAIIEGTLFSGFHDECDGDTTQRLTANALSNGARDTSFKPTFDKYWGVRGIGGTANALVVAGDFTRVNGVSVQGFAIFPARWSPPAPVKLDPSASWRYLVSPTGPGAGWTSPGFNDAAWALGAAQLGYGDGDEETVVGYGPSSSSKYITTWFRTTFTATSIPATLSLDLLADDGAVVYINGVEVVRDNMPSGTITATTRASSGRSGSAENAFRTFTLSPSAVSVGTNTIAVEVHQDSSSSSDMSFAAAIRSTADPNTPPPSSTSTTSTTSTTTTTVPGAALYSTDFSGPNGAAWGAEWTTSAANGSVSTQGGSGRMSFNDVSSANGRASLSGVTAVADASALLSYRFGSTGDVGYLNVYLRGSGGWANSYRPANGYGVELNSKSTTVTLKRASGGSSTTLASVSGAQSVSTAKQWLRLRVTGTTVQFRTWLDGQSEPTAWNSTVVDASVTSPGTLWISFVRGSSNSGARHVDIDDLTITGGA